MRPTFPHPRFLKRAALLRSVEARKALLVEAEAPASAPNPAVVDVKAVLRRHTVDDDFAGDLASVRELLNIEERS
jgi:hypothetical protein